MTRRGFHIVLALTLVACVLCPYVEVAVHCNQSIFDNGYDGESTVALIALLLILAFALAKLLAYFIGDTTGQERLVNSPSASRPMHDLISVTPDISPPLALRI